MWARGYFCATVGAVDEATIKAYIESQKWTKTIKALKSPRPPSLEPALSRAPSDSFSRTRPTFSRHGFYRLSAGSRLTILRVAGIAETNWYIDR